MIDKVYTHILITEKPTLEVSGIIQHDMTISDPKVVAQVLRSIADQYDPPVSKTVTRNV